MLETQINTKEWLLLKNLPNEIWKDVKGYEGIYQVSNYGRIKALRRIKKSGIKNNFYVVQKERILRQFINEDKYCYVTLYKNGRNKSKRVHRLVAEVFLDNNDKQKSVINHIDKNACNNRVSNLEYCTQAYNARYSLAKKVKQLSLTGNLIKIWDSTMDVERNTGISNVGISYVCNRKRKTAGGYKWEYIKEA